MMQKTIDDLQTLLTGSGYYCKRLPDVIVAAKVSTATYKNTAGEKRLKMLLAFADAWYEQITTAMEKGTFDTAKVGTLDLSRMAAGPGWCAARAANTTEQTSDAARAAALTAKPGAHHNRLRAL